MTTDLLLMRIECYRSATDARNRPPSQKNALPSIGYWRHSSRAERKWHLFKRELAEFAAVLKLRLAPGRKTR
jgi:hypothetical protein